MDADRSASRKGPFARRPGEPLGTHPKFRPLLRRSGFFRTLSGTLEWHMAHPDFSARGRLTGNPGVFPLTAWKVAFSVTCP
jgi:hypothetical protein